MLKPKERRREYFSTDIIDWKSISIARYKKRETSVKCQVLPVIEIKSTHSLRIEPWLTPLYTTSAKQM